MRRVTVYRVARKRRCGIGGVCGSALVSTAIHTERHAYQTQRVNLVAGFQRTILEVGSALLRAGRLDIRRVFVYLAYALTPAPDVVTGSTVGVAVVIVYADSELSALHSAEQSASLSAVVHVGRRRGGVSRQAAALGYDIKYAAHSLGIVFRSGVGYHLNTLHAVCRKAFKHLRRIVAHHIVGASVDINLERTAAVHLYVVISIYRHERHLAQHFEHRVRLRVGVVGYVIFYLVDVRLHQRLLHHHLDTLELVGGIVHIHRSQIHRSTVGRCLEFPDNRLTAHRCDRRNVVAGTFQVHHKTSFLVCHLLCHRLRRRFLACYRHRGIRFSVIGQRVEQYTFQLERHGTGLRRHR